MIMHILKNDHAHLNDYDDSFFCLDVKYRTNSKSFDSFQLFLIIYNNSSNGHLKLLILHYL